MFEYGSVEQDEKKFPWGVLSAVVAFILLLVVGYLMVS